MLLPILAVGALVAADDPSSLDPSTPLEVASAVASCWDSVSATGVDRARLGERGWSVVAATADLAASPLQAWAKQGANDLIMLTDDPRASDYCMVIARLSSRGDVEQALGAVHSTLKTNDAQVIIQRTEGGGIAFASLPRFAEVDSIDAVGATEEQPALRIIVGYQVPEQP